MFRRLGISFNTKPMAGYLTNCDLWDEHPQRRIFPNSPHSEMTDIWARFGDVSSGDYSILGKEHDSIWYPSAELIPCVKRVCLDIMSEVDGERLGGVLITKLPSGGNIKPHVDSGWHAEYYEKFYVAIRNPEGCEFGFESGTIRAEDGECYWFRNNVTHWVTNPSKEDRIAMIVCIKTDKFLGVK
jgi:quercetin dioxygenase-like cupin family protein